MRDNELSFKHEYRDADEPHVTLPMVAPDGLEDREDSTIVLPASAGPSPAHEGPRLDGAELRYDSSIVGLALSEVSVVLVEGQPVVVPLPRSMAVDAGFVVVDVDDSVLLHVGVVRTPDPAAPDRVATARVLAEKVARPTNVQGLSAAHPSDAELHRFDEGGDGMLADDVFPLFDQPDTYETATAVSVDVASKSRPDDGLAGPSVSPVPPASEMERRQGEVERRHGVEVATEMSQQSPTGGPDTPAPALQCANLRWKSSSGFELRIDDLTLFPHELLVVQGDEASGKTSFIRVISRFLDATNGSIRVGHEFVANRDPDLRTVREAAMVACASATPRFVPDLSVVENVEMGFLLEDVNESDARAAALAALHELGVSHLGDRRADTLARSEAVRIGLARALVTKPSVVAVDDITLALNDDTVSDLLYRLLLAAYRGSAVVITTTDPRVWQALVEERGALSGSLERGVLVLDDPVAGLTHL